MKPINNLFNQKEVNRIFSHIPPKTLRWWGMKGAYGWVNETADKRGIHRQYELGNLYQIGIVEELSSLNIPGSSIQVLMHQHFYSGLGMNLPDYMIPPELMSDKWQPANVVDKMDKILVIAKQHAGFWARGGPDRSKEELVIGWKSFLLPREEAIGTGPGDGVYRSFKLPKIEAAIAGFSEEDVVTLIFIDLQIIKRNVDYWIKIS